MREGLFSNFYFYLLKLFKISNDYKKYFTLQTNNQVVETESGSALKLLGRVIAAGRKEITWGC